MRGIELPAGTENRKYSGGFYVADSAVFTTENPTRDWDIVDNKLCTAIYNTFTGLFYVDDKFGVIDSLNTENC